MDQIQGQQCFHENGACLNSPVQGVAFTHRRGLQGQVVMISQGELIGRSTHYCPKGLPTPFQELHLLGGPGDRMVRACNNIDGCLEGMVGFGGLGTANIRSEVHCGAPRGRPHAGSPFLWWAPSPTSTHSSHIPRTAHPLKLPTWT